MPELAVEKCQNSADFGGQKPVILLMKNVLNSGGQNVLNSGEKTLKKGLKITDYGVMGFYFENNGKK